MPNEKNLIPVNKRTKNEQREITSKGGKKSGESRRRKKSMKQVMNMLLQMPANTPSDRQMLCDMGIDANNLDEDTVNNLLIVSVALLKNAKNGDISSIKELRNIIQDNAFENHKIAMDKAYLDIERKKVEPPVSSGMENNLFEAINSCGEDGFDDLPEIQQAAENDVALVENGEIPE